MKPAFPTGRSAAIFSLFLALVVAGPGLAALVGLVDESKNYPTFTWGIGEFPWIQSQIFERTGDIDIAFMGSSHMWTAVNTPLVQRELSERLHRRAEVVTLGWNWSGYDALYSVASDLLEHRKVHTIVIYDENLHRLDDPHPMSYRMIQIGGHPGELDGMTWPMKAQVYAGAVLAFPRHLLSLVRPDQVERPNQWGMATYLTSLKAADLTHQMGALRAGKVMEATPVIETGSPSSLPPTVADVMVCTEGGPQAEAYTESRIGPYNLFFARKFAKLCRDHGTQVIALHIPVSGQENERVITECQPWSEVLGIHVDLIGIPGARLFAGIPQADAHKYFYEKDHLNGNGQDLFTPLITPSLINLYEHPNDQE